MAQRGGGGGGGSGSSSCASSAVPLHHRLSSDTRPPSLSPISPAQATPASSCTSGFPFSPAPPSSLYAGYGHGRGPLNMMTSQSIVAGSTCKQSSPTGLQGLQGGTVYPGMGGRTQTGSAAAPPPPPFYLPSPIMYADCVYGDPRMRQAAVFKHQFSPSIVSPYSMST